MKTKFTFLIYPVAVVLLTIASCKKAPDLNNRDGIPDNYVYKTVTIGKQIWMAENLKATKYSNGDNLDNPTDWSSASKGSYCNFAGIADNSKTYGRWYNLLAITDSRKIAPKGWHIPTLAEWDTLVKFLGGEKVAGGKMKEKGTSASGGHWSFPNEGATDSSGFNALPAGYVNNIGGQGTAPNGDAAYFWIAPPPAGASGIANTQWVFELNSSWAGTGYYDYNLKDATGISIRCIKD
jgi:uncharacterized protein (TIGR02145 family)